MHKFIMISASLAALGLTPAIAAADTVVIVEPEVETWVMEQPPGAVTVEEDIAVGETLPDNVDIIEVPEHVDYGYAYVNRHRVIVDAATGEVLAIY